ncbi:retention module-containing protein [Agarivorans aestuarii]|uniref:retention module-containing protein n=1 Tax=Agarivorans aestuarii TaxID=1563703 RepID=UPI001C7F4B19|nr:retention module-containing protein [Agarivorans aestuarii]
MEQSIATSSATIVSIQGQAFAVDAQGNIRPLQPGDTIAPGELIITSQGAQLGFYYGDEQYLLGDNSATQLPEFDPSQALSQLSAANDLDVEALQQAILEGADPTELFEATAAGGAAPAGDGSSAGNGGFVTIDRIGGETIAQAGFDTQSPATSPELVDTDNEVAEPLAVNSSSNGPTPPAPSPDQAPTVNLSVQAIAEGAVDTDTVVATFSSSDPDGDEITHSLVNDPQGFFVIDGNEIKLTEAGVAAVNDDQLNLTSLNITIQAEANGLTASDSADLSIARTDDGVTPPVDQGPSITVTAEAVTEESVDTNTVVANFSSSDPEGDAQTYALLNNGDGYFALDGNQVKLTDAGVAAVNNDQLNLTELEVSVEVTANGQTASDSDTAAVNRVDEGPSITVTAEAVTEESVDTNTVVANFSSSDPEGDAQTYALLNNGDGYFVLDGNQVKLTDVGVAAINNDQLNLTELEVSVEVTANGQTASDSDTAAVNRVDEGPSITVTAEAVTEESVDTNTVVANFSSSDPEGDAQTYALLNNGDGYFVLDGNQVKLTDAGVAAVNNDQLNLTELEVSVEVTANGQTASDSDTAAVNRVDEGPSITVTAEAVTEESVDTNTVVANFSSSDPEGDAQTYALLNNGDGYFVLDGNQVKLTDAGVAAVNNDQLNLTELEVSVEVTANGQTASDSDTAAVNRVDEGPSITVTAEAVTEESVDTNTVVANFSSSDPEGDAQTYALLNNGDGYFVLDGNQVKLTDVGVAAVNNDQLNLTELEVSVEVTANGQTASDSDTAAVNRVDEGPSITVTAEAVTEESVDTNTVVANFSSSDPEGDAQTYVLLNNGDGYFVLDGNQVKLTDVGVAAVNNDQLNLTELEVSVEVTANGQTASDSDTAAVNRVDEGPSITVTAEAVTEESVDTNTVVANFSSSDPEGDAQTYALLNNGDGYFVLDGNQVKLTDVGVAAVNNDQLNLTELEVSVEVTANGQTASDSDTAAVNRVDEGPSITVTAEAVTEESVDTNTVVANFSSSDPEGDAQTYALLNNGDGYFVLDGNQVKLTDVGVAAVNNDQLNLTELEVSVEVTANGQTASDSDTAAVNRVDEGPSITVTAEAVTEESVDTNTVVANFSSSDPEGDAQTYALLNNGDGYFVLDGNQVKLTDVGVAAVNNDQLNLTELEVSVEVTANGQTASDSDTADINRVNESPVANDDDFSLAEPGETVQLNLLANDTDPESDVLAVKSINGTLLTPGVAQTIAVAQGVVNVSDAGAISFTADADGTGAVNFNYVVQDSAGAESTANVSGNVVNLANDSAQVAESGLATGSDPSALTSSATGNLLANDDGLIDGLELSSVVYQGVPHTADANGVILIDTNQGQLSVYTEDYNGFSKGDYEYQLESSSLAGDGVSESFNYVVANPASGFVTQATLEVNIVDDTPVGNDVSHSLESSPLLVTTNLVLVLDTSASMTNGEHGDGLNYLDIAVEALSNLIEQADAAGNVNVQIVGFSDSVISSGWISDNVEDALSYLQDLSSGGGTHYDLALNQVISSSTSDQQPDADNTLLYFISDGEPNFGYGIDDTVEYKGSNGLAAWDEFVQDNVDTSFGVGIGQADLEVLKDVASESATDEFAFIVDDVTDLSTTLVESYLEAEVDASLGLLQTASTDGFMVGADDGYVSAITVDGTTYSYDPNAVPEQEKNLSITTALGGVLLLNFVTGAYSYELDVGGDGWGQQENLAVTVTDFDGDTSSINIEINTVFEAVVDANRDVIITNQDGSSAISVPSLALLWNDTGEGISFDEIGDVIGGSVEVSDTNDILFSSDDGVGVGVHESNFETESVAAIGVEDLNDSDLFATNNSLETAIDLSNRNLFSSNDSNIVRNVDGYSYSLQGSIKNDSNPLNGVDEDWVKLTLAEGEGLYVNLIPGPDSDSRTVKELDVYIYDSKGELLSQFDEYWAGTRGDYTAEYEGDYYLKIVAEQPDDNATYQLNMTIVTDGANYQRNPVGDILEEFEYSIIGDGALDTTTAELIGVQGSSIDGGEGDEVLVGNEAANAIGGDAGDDALVGYAGDDQLDGGAGEDLLIGGQGNDILTGGDDSDMFAWLDGDDQSTSNDTVTDFTLKADGDADVLDLSDLLQGETEASLESYLSFETVNNGGNVETIISIDKDGASNGESVHQTITLKDVDFSGMSDSEILSQLIEDQQLNVDN